MFPPLTDFMALLGISLVTCALCARLWRARPGVWAWCLLALCFALLWVPVGAAQLPIAAYVRGITSDLSLTSVLLACLSLGQRHGGLPPTARRESMLLYGALAAAAVFLYPTALGWGDWDAYRPGWGDWALWAILLALALASWMREFRLLPVAIACALLGWSISLMESTNLWDYLMDPWLAIAAILACVRTGLGHSFAIFRLNNAHRRVEANFEPSPRDSRTP